MNDIMSFGLHRSWKKKVVSLMDINESSVVLDLASGSGDLANLIKKKSNCSCIIYDANTKMLLKAKKKLMMEFIYQERLRIYHSEITFLIMLLLVLD